MRKIINMDKVTEVTVIMIEKLKTIEEVQTKLNADIEMLNECYKGIDADLIKSKYLITVKNIDALKNTIDSYIKYFKWLVESYGENLNSAMKNYNSIMETLAVDNSELTESEITSLSFGNIYNLGNNEDIGMNN